MSKLSEKEFQQLKVKAGTYRILMGVFAVVGLIVFLILYVKNIEGNIVESLRNPSTIFMIIIPFIPAIVFSFKYKKITKQMTKK